MKQQKFKVSTTLKEGHASKLFDYIASSVDSFLTEIGTEVKEEDRLKLGFTFSFPVLQTQINKGTLINWTKGFKCPGAQGEDIVALLQTALDKQHIHVEVSAFLIVC
jgi:hexokinase